MTASRVLAVRRELSAMEAAAASAVDGKAVLDGRSWSVDALRTAIRAVKRDLVVLEMRAAPAPRCCSSACDLCWRDQIVALVAPAFAAERGENINLASALPTAAEIG